MDIVEKRFENFKLFIREKTPNENEFIKEFVKLPMDFFLNIIKKKSQNGITKEKCLEEIFNEAKLKKEDYKNEDIDKLILYMEYFHEISKCIS